MVSEVRCSTCFSEGALARSCDKQHCPKCHQVFCIDPEGPTGGALDLGKFEPVGMFISCSECGDDYEAAYDTIEYDRLYVAVQEGIDNDDWTGLLCDKCSEESNGRI